MSATESPNLRLPYILAAQAQKHVTHNEAIRALDALVQITVLDRNLSAPPASPDEGARYIVAGSPTGAWSGQANAIAAFQDGAWAFYAPREGWLAWVAGEDILVVWTGTAWTAAAAGGGGGGVASVNPVPLVGVNATADATNRLSVSSPATLLNHAGAGHQLKLNKAAAGDTASLLYQTSFFGRAEMGLAGNDDFAVKVSADGTSWREALVVDRSSGTVAMPSTPSAENLLINGDMAINQRTFANGALAVGVYGPDRWRGHSSGTSLSIAGEAITLGSGSIAQVIEEDLWGALANQVFTCSVENLTGGSLTVTLAGQTATITPGAGRRGVSFTVPASTTGNLTLSLAATNATFRRIKLERGSVATPWLNRPSMDELRYCQRYFQRIAGTAPYILAVCRSAFIMYTQRLLFVTPMRTVPTMAMTNPAGTSPNWEYLTTGWIASTATSAPLVDAASFTLLINGSGLTTGQGILVSGLWRADAEL